MARHGVATATYDGCVLVIANYNGGPPGAIKNAIDYLYNEETTKPIMIISYGIQGSKTASDSLKNYFGSPAAQGREDEADVGFSLGWL